MNATFSRISVDGGTYISNYYSNIMKEALCSDHRTNTQHIWKEKLAFQKTS